LKLNEKDICVTKVGLFAQFFNKLSTLGEGGLLHRGSHVYFDQVTEDGSYIFATLPPNEGRYVIVPPEWLEHHIKRVNTMKFNDYQEKVQKTLIYRDSIEKILVGLGLDRDHPAFDGVSRLLEISYASLGMGESGEVQGKVKKVIRDSGGVISDEVRSNIAGELGDLLWYLAATADEFDLSLEGIAEDNLAKLADRKARGVIQGSGDER
jgi:NTP pyrophosphatase (non-canonical NTP hydrolase)